MDGSTVDKHCTWNGFILTEHWWLIISLLQFGETLKKFTQTKKSVGYQVWQS